MGNSRSFGESAVVRCAVWCLEVEVGGLGELGGRQSPMRGRRVSTLFLPFGNVGRERKVCGIAICKVGNGGKKDKKKSKNAERSCCVVVADARPEDRCVSCVFLLFRSDVVRNQA